MNESYLIFGLAEELFAVRVGKIIEVIEPEIVTPVPEVPQYIKGISNYRGNILPIVDLRRKFNIADKDDTNDCVIIVLDALIKGKQTHVGIWVDYVRTVFNVGFAEIDRIPEFGTSFTGDYIEGIVTRDSKYIVLLKIDKILDTDDMIIINQDGAPIPSDKN